MMRSILILLLPLLLGGCFLLQAPEASSGAAVAPTLAPAATGVGDSAESAPTATVFTIDPRQTEARFIIEEVLRGADTTVVGISNNVAGQIALDLDDPAAAQVGAIVVDARVLVTDNGFRNRAIANEILVTPRYESITFTPTAVSGLPNTVTLGETYSVQITGDLTITDVSRPATFATTVTPVSTTELRGLATTTIAYGDWGIRVPFSQQVQAVAETVTLELAFVALAAP